MENYLDQLNESQRLAVECTEGPVMIIAGAGSGKTRVLTYRVAHLMQKGIDPFNILALTFTNKAAREMKNRISTLAGDEARNLWMGTFHSVFARILRVEAHRLGFPSNFTIYDTDDSKSLIKTILREQNLDDKVYKPSMVLNRISSAKNNLMSYIEYAENVELINDDRLSGKPHLAAIFELYTKRCFKAGAMDFDDLLYHTYVLLKNFPDELNKYQHKFKYLMVDEFQDTNFVQYMIVRKIAALNENICVVGDDAQSIYAFRGANIQNILSFEKDYPDLNVFKLEQNYRSTKNIVSAANSVILNNRNQLRKEVWTDNDHGAKIKVLRALSDNEEGSMVANSIFQDKMNHQLHNKDFAILYRTNAQSRSMEEALRRMNIPYRIYGGLSFYSRKEIKDVLAYFRLTINPNDEEALKRVINYPARGIGQTSVDKLVVAADQSEKSIWEVLENIHTVTTGIATNTREKIADFVSMIKSFRVMMKTHNAYDLASYIANTTGILRDLYNDKTPEGLGHYENIQELLNGIKEFTIATNYDSGTNLPTDESISQSENELTNQPILQSPKSLDLYMQDIALLTDAETKDDGDNNKVSLMTIHSAKGLEFKEVFVVGLEENLFPSQMSMNSRADLEEERRLFYVAMTRAEKMLTLTYAVSRYRWGNLVGCEPSRFLEEVHPDFIEFTNIPKKKENESSWGSFHDDDFSQSRLNNQRKANFQQRKPQKTNFVPLTKLHKASSATVENDFVADDPSQIVIGMEVEHQKFGTGKVIHLEGNFPDNKATVFFPAEGNKQLLLKYAKLKIVK
ncbi:MAG: UvrD-helicase domain-containing protein [Bacteroidota bacterium]